MTLERIVPEGFTFDVVGAAGALAYFGRLDRERIAHAYLFSGPAGVGKKTFARALAQSLLCETPKPGLLGFCTHCTGCTLFVAGTHPDFVSSEGQIRIGNDGGRAADGEITSRDLVRDLSLHGYRSAFRVVILGDVEFATHEAANALLKFLEEPPAGVVLILTTDSPARLLATIRSRLLDIAFPPLSKADVVRVLEAEGFAASTALRAADASLGSIARARAVMNGDGEGFREGAYAWFVEAMNGRVAEQGFLHLDDRSLSGAEKRAAVAELIEIVRVAARDWTALTLAGEAPPMLASDQTERLRQIAPRPAARTAAMLGAIGDVAQLARSNVSAGLVVDSLRLALAP